jgi:hypothetical protein
MAVVSNLCQRSILLEGGSVKFFGPTPQAISQYQSNLETIRSRYKPTDEQLVESKGLPYFHLRAFYLTLESGEELHDSIEAKNNTQIVINIEGDVKEVDIRFNLGFTIRNERGECVILSMSTDQPESDWPVYKIGNTHHIKTQLDTSSLNEGVYTVYFVASLHCVRMLYTEQDDICVSFTVYGNRGNSPYWINARQSTLAPRIPWKLEESPI